MVGLVVEQVVEHAVALLLHASAILQVQVCETVDEIRLEEWEWKEGEWKNARLH